jgi:hypothetical protein
MKIPCKDCLIIPLCKNKHFNSLLTDCDYVHEFMKVTIDDNAHLQRHRIEEIEKTLNPTRWNITQSGLLEEKLLLSGKK